MIDPTFGIELDDYEAFISFVDRNGIQWAHAQMSKMMGPDLADRAKRRYEYEVSVVATVSSGGYVHSQHTRWYPGPQPNDRYWPPLKGLLLEKRPEPEVINLDQESTRVLDLSESPGNGKFPSRGLVMGFVQSGKTGNFTAVGAKAVDRGYRLVIILSGVTDSLRDQTQERLDKELVDLNKEYWAPLTSVGHDFVPPATATNYLSDKHNQRILCVVKKNAFRLDKLAKWLKSAELDVLKKCPVLIVDDEADQASVATKRLNPLIRSLIEILPKASYIGYTASPFANFLIDPSAGDLYPSQFIYAMRKPMGHFGTESIFGRVATEDDMAEPETDASGQPVPLDGYDMVRIVPDDDVPPLKPNKKEIAAGLDLQLPESLRESIRYFLLASACRRVRGVGNRHSTMLVHTSVNTKVHQAFIGPIQRLLKQYELDLSAGDAATDAAFRLTWEREIDRVPADRFGNLRVRYQELREQLVRVAHECDLIMDNYRSEARLSYSDDEAVPPVLAVVVGGNTLSRGLTLEGLVASYFVRGASAYDTLLQMGRWFGYRAGFEDLPRVWITAELRDWFRHLALVEAEVRIDIDRYFRENLTPETFAVRIRKHPKLAITAASRMGSAVTAYASYGGHRVQPRYFKRKDEAWLTRNRLAAEQLVNGILTNGGAFVPRHDRRELLLASDVEVELVLRFLEKYQYHEDEFDKSSKLLAQYIQEQTHGGLLRDWTVAIVGNDPVETTSRLSLAGREVAALRRSRLKDSADPARADIKTLMSKEHYVLDLTDMTMAEARKKSEGQLGERKRRQVSGLLALYPIDRTSEPDPSNKEFREPLGAAVDTVAAAFVFPGTGDEKGVQYVSADIARLHVDPDDIEEEDAAILEEAWAK